MKKDIYEKYKFFCNQYKLTGYNIKKLWVIIRPICYHKEFIKRMYDPYWHHDCKTVGEHIICDAIVTYRLITKLKKRNKKFNFINLKAAVYIAMFHDLYEEPWQNNLKFKEKKFKNQHAFIHPIESAVNAITWFPKIFEDERDALIIIDGIIHHMFPLPVRAIDGTNLELNNQNQYEKLPSEYKKIMVSSTLIGKIGAYSLRKSFYLEGRLMSKADKIVAMRKDIHSLEGYLALLTGKNKKLKDKEG